MLMRIFLLVLFVALNIVGAGSESTSSTGWLCSIQREWCALSSIHQTMIIGLLIVAVLWIVWRWIKGGNCNCQCSDNDSDNDDSVHKL